MALTVAEKEEAYTGFLKTYAETLQLSTLYVNRVFCATYRFAYGFEPGFDELYATLSGKDWEWFQIEFRDLLDAKWEMEEYFPEIVLKDMVKFYPDIYGKKFDLVRFSQLLFRFQTLSWDIENTYENRRKFNAEASKMGDRSSDYEVLKDFVFVYEKDSQQFLDLLDQLHYFQTHRDFMRTATGSIKTAGSFWDHFGHRNTSGN